MTVNRAPHSSARVTPWPVTGYAILNAMGRRNDTVVAALRDGRSGLRAPPVDLPYDTVYGDLGGLDELPEELRGYESRLARIALASVQEIIPSVRRAATRWGPDRVAILFGTSTAGIDRTEWAYTRFVQDGVLPSDYDFRQQHAFDAPARMLQEVLGVSGPSYVISTACSSSGKTFGSARRLLDAGVVDAVLVGGIDARCFMTLRGFHSLGILNPQRCTPFGKDRAGMNIGEGGAWVLLERETPDGGEAPVYLLGVGETCDAYHMTSPHPEGRGAMGAMTAALAQAGVAASDVSTVNAHGTGTVLNDAAEGRAINAVLGADVPVASTKAYTGHLLGACAATEAVFSIVAVEQGWIPKSLGAEVPDPDIPVRLAHEVLQGPCDFVLSNAFAFGGNNASVLFGRRTR